MQPAYENAISKIERRQRLDDQQILSLYRHASILDLGSLAHHVKLRLNGTAVWFNEHRYVRTTWDQSDERPSLDTLIATILNRCAAVVTTTTTEFRFGSLHPARISYGDLLTILQAMRAAYPKIGIRALSARHILEYAQRENLEPRSLLESLYAHGVESLDGRGAGLFGVTSGRSGGLSPTVDVQQWLAIHRLAHQIGMRSDATMAYGYGESLEARVQHLRMLRDLQDETRGFRTFIPLPPPYQTPDMTVNHDSPAFDDWRTLAISRIYLDNFPHISTVWGRLGLDNAQVALHFGVDDLEGAISHDQNLRLIGYRPFRAVNRRELRQLIQKGGMVPRERGPRFLPVGASTDAPETISNKTLTREQQSLLFYKIEKQQILAFDEAITLAQHADLIELGEAAAHLRRQKADENVITYQAPLREMIWDEPTSKLKIQPIDSKHGSEALPDSDIPMLLDMAQLPPNLFAEVNPTQRCRDLVASIQHLRESRPAASTLVRGIKALWGLANQCQRPLPQLMQELRLAGVVTLESSDRELESDLTVSELTEIHREAHAAGIATITKVELAAPYHGEGEVFWDAFIHRLFGLESLQRATGGLLAIRVATARGAYISPVEFLRAVTLVRLLCPSVPNLTMSLQNWPSLVSTRKTSLADHTGDLMRSAQIAICFGVNDLGTLPAAMDAHQLELPDLKKLGKRFAPRDCRFLHFS